MRSPPSNSSPRAPRGDEPRHSPQGDGGRLPTLLATRRFGRLKALSLSKGYPPFRQAQGPELVEGLPATSKAFTLVEVMMAAVILLVGFIGMIEAVVIGAGMMDNARRQTLAAQILNHHAEKLRLLPWDVTTAAPNELCINDLPTGDPTPTSITIDPQFATAIAASGATFTLTRTTATVVSGSLREATFTIEWKVKTSRRDSAEEQLTFTYSRTLPAFYGKYGLNLTYQRS